MNHYRLPELDLASRIMVAVEMILPIPERPWGRVSELSRIYQISRTSLYEMRDKVLQAMVNALSPQRPGPKPFEEVVEINKGFVDRTITVLPMITGTVRGIQQGLELILGVHRSVGYISERLNQSGSNAAHYNASMSVPLPVLGEADEIFQGRRPHLTVVDGRSFLVLHFSKADGRDATHWGLSFLEMQERGIQFHDLASDGAKGIHAGLREAELLIPLRPDLFHLIREFHSTSGYLERRAYQAIEVAEKARRAEREAQAPQRRRGARLKVKVPRAQAEQEEQQGIALLDGWQWLVHEMRQALEPITPSGHIARAGDVRDVLDAGLQLLMELSDKRIVACARKFSEHLDELIAPIAWLDQSLAPWIERLSPDTQSLIIWSWQHRHELSIQPGEGFPIELQPTVRAFWDALSLFHRSSSLAEAFHSWIRPHLQIHRGMPKWLSPLLMLFWNHHRFNRGKRAGKSPAQWAGVPQAPSLTEVLDQILSPHHPSDMNPPSEIVTMPEQEDCDQILPLAANF